MSMDIDYGDSRGAVGLALSDEDDDLLYATVEATYRLYRYSGAHDPDGPLADVASRAWERSNTALKLCGTMDPEDRLTVSVDVLLLWSLATRHQAVLTDGGEAFEAAAEAWEALVSDVYDATANVAKEATIPPKPDEHPFPWVHDDEGNFPSDDRDD